MVDREGWRFVSLGLGCLGYWFFVGFGFVLVLNKVRIVLEASTKTERSPFAAGIQSHSLALIPARGIDAQSCTSKVLVSSEPLSVPTTH